MSSASHAAGPRETTGAVGRPFLEVNRMDVKDSALRAELDRRLVTLERDESGDPAHAPLAAADLWLLAAIVVALAAAGWVMA